MGAYGNGGSGAGTSPGGSDTQIQYNDTGSFAGDSKLTYDSTNGSVTLGGATVTADSPVLNLSQTWNNGAVAFTGLKLDVTNTASSSSSNLVDLTVDGSSVFELDASGQCFFPRVGGNQSGIVFGGVSVSDARTYVGQYGFRLYNSTSLGWSSGINLNNLDVTLHRDSSGVLAQRNSTNAQAFRCYGTYTDASNYVRASLSADSTSTTLAAETAGTGADDVPLNLTAAGAGTVKVNSVAEVAVSSTVAGLPSSPTVGMISRVTDADTPSVGSTVTGSGASPALVWYNGTNWTVIGV